MVERKRQTRKRSLDSDSEQVEYVQEMIAHFIPLDHLPDGVLATVFSFCSSEAATCLDRSNMLWLWGMDAGLLGSPGT